MSIPFKDLTGADVLAAAGYLIFLPWATKDTWLGALFIMNARGEPLEFTHARVRSPNRLLWRPDILEVRCLASLASALFKACPVTPDIILCLAGEIHPGLFGEYLRLESPIGYVSPGKDVVTEWISEPGQGSQAAALFERLSKHNLLLEPFERAEAGLREVYSEILTR